VTFLCSICYQLLRFIPVQYRFPISPYRIPLSPFTIINRVPYRGSAKLYPAHPQAISVMSNCPSSASFNGFQHFSNCHSLLTQYLPWLTLHNQYSDTPVSNSHACLHPILTLLQLPLGHATAINSQLPSHFFLCHCIQSLFDAESNFVYTP
jgi:hypothetical protein